MTLTNAEFSAILGDDQSGSWATLFGRRMKTTRHRLSFALKSFLTAAGRSSSEQATIR